MKFLFCCESFWPHIGGVQKVILEVALQCIDKGHEVHIATSKDKNRTTLLYQGIHIHDFEVHGNLVNGISGEVQLYRDFLFSNFFDAILVKAAQQWSFDAMIGFFRQIKSPVYHIPCGYSNLRHPRYRQYFSDMPSTLKQVAGLIYYSDTYQDVKFAREHGISKYSLIPNGISLSEFNHLLTATKSKQLSAITIGSPPVQKGHMESLKAYLSSDLWRDGSLTLNGDYIGYPDNPTRVQSLKRIIYALLVNQRMPLPSPQDIEHLVDQSSFHKRTVQITYLDRSPLLERLANSHVFLFASHIEYSPLVLFESAAAGTPFLSLDVGNAHEIAEWTGGGIVGPKPNVTRKAISWLTHQLDTIARDPEPWLNMGKQAQKRTLELFNWSRITDFYIQVLSGRQVRFDAMEIQ